eukprot:1157512-Pelagomonas_calceolata.AAC.12
MVHMNLASSRGHCGTGARRRMMLDANCDETQAGSVRPQVRGPEAAVGVQEWGQEQGAGS